MCRSEPINRLAAKGVEMTRPNPMEVRIYRLAALCVVLSAISFTVPRFVPNPEGGFASGASAILTFLVLLGATLLLSVYLFSVTVQQFSTLSTLAKVVGVGPSVVLAVTLLGLLGFLSY